MYRLTILEGSLAGHSFAIGQGDFVIGSAEGSDAMLLPRPEIRITTRIMWRPGDAAASR